MIVMPVQLCSAINGSVRNLGTLVIDNQGGTDARCDYRCRMYAKGAFEKHGNNPGKLISLAKPIRTGTVVGHARKAEPVHNLIAKALESMNYG